MRQQKNNREIPDGSDWDKRFGQLYKEKGLMRGDKFDPLHKVCERRDICWRGGSDRYLTDLTRAGIIQPYVGKCYDESRLLCIGINANVGGDYDQLKQEVKDARLEIEAGEKIVFKKPDYRGTKFYYWLGVYAATLLSRKRIIKDSSGPDEVMKERVSEAFDYIALTEHIKCSPEGYDGEPLPDMWKECGKHILQHEVKLLKPKIILIMGLGNFHAYRDFVDLDRLPKIRWAKTNSNQLLVGVPHPTYSNSEEVRKELLQIDIEQWR